MNCKVKLQEFERELTIDDFHAVVRLMRSILSRDIELSRTLADIVDHDAKIMAYEKRYEGLVQRVREVIRSKEPIDIGDIEHMWVIGLAGDARVSFLSLVALGDVHGLQINPVDIMRAFEKERSRRMIVVHTHPTDIVVTPSNEDVAFTKRILYTCIQYGIVLEDHVILGSNDAYSFLQGELMPPLVRELIAESKDKVMLEQEKNYAQIMHQQAELALHQAEEQLQKTTKIVAMMTKGYSFTQAVTELQLSPSEIEAITATLNNSDA